MNAENLRWHPGRAVPLAWQVTDLPGSLEQSGWTQPRHTAESQVAEESATQSDRISGRTPGSR